MRGGGADLANCTSAQPPHAARTRLTTGKYSRPFRSFDISAIMLRKNRVRPNHSRLPCPSVSALPTTWLSRRPSARRIAPSRSSACSTRYSSRNVRLRTWPLRIRSRCRILLDDKLSILDVKAVDAARSVYDVEVQLQVRGGVGQAARVLRLRALHGRTPQGDPYAGLPPVYGIWLIDGLLWPQSNQVHHAFRLTDAASDSVLDDTLAIHTIELPKYNTAYPGFGWPATC